MSNLPANIQQSLTERQIDQATWITLQNSVFPGAREESILLAIDYCKARKLDILKKPCHIVPMSVTDARTGNKLWRDVIMPGIYEQRITAFRTGQMAGQDEPEFGEDFTYKEVVAPKWCKVTVYRFVNGQRCAFSHTEYFSEACTTTKDGNVNSMWTRRPRGQLAKCAEAGALRKAFPDELGGVMTADEMLEEQMQTNHEAPKSTVIETQSVELITTEQLEQMKGLIDFTQSNAQKLLAFAGNAPSLEQITKANAEIVIQKLMKKLSEQQAQDEHLGEDIPL